MKLLLAEDTVDLNRALTAVLTHEGYAVDSVTDGQAASDHIENDAYDCIILDIMMPKKNGIEVLQELRDKNILTPVLMLTAKAEIEDRVAGLDAGADDYLTKPFAIKELLARVRAMTRRKNHYNSKDLSYIDLTLKAETLELGAENSVRLSLREFELMQILILHREKPLSPVFLIERVWENDPDVSIDTVRLYISYLKRKLMAIASRVQISGDADTGFTLSEGGTL